MTVSFNIYTEPKVPNSVFKFEIVALFDTSKFANNVLAILAPPAIVKPPPDVKLIASVVF